MPSYGPYINSFLIPGGAFEKIEATISPFGYHRGEGVNMGADESEWIVARERYKYDPIFEQLDPINGKVKTPTF